MGLRRIRGIDRDASRFIDQSLIATVRERVVGVAGLAIDLLDRRARVLSLEVESEGWQGIFVREIIAHLHDDARGSHFLTLVIDVRADFPDLHSDLETLDFFPSIYYPALIATPTGRNDRSSFITRFIPYSMEHLYRMLTLPQARNVILSVCAAQRAAGDVEDPANNIRGQKGLRAYNRHK